MFCDYNSVHQLIERRYRGRCQRAFLSFYRIADTCLYTGPYESAFGADDRSVTLL